MPHLIVMAAGTGGHIIPGIAVAREMQSRGWTVSWLGTPMGMENRLVPPTGMEMDRIDFTGMRGKGPLLAIDGAWNLLRSLGTCWGILRDRGADAVLGMGGYVCMPGGIVAWLRRKPLVLVNADAGLLLSNKALLPFAKVVAFGFDGPAAKIPRGVVTGNPVRAPIEALPPPAVRFAGRQGPLRVLVVGGSLGAQVLNETLPKALASLPADVTPHVVHQTGQAQFKAVQREYQAADLHAEVVPFIDDMAEQLARCDLIICRAGAVTVSELCVAGVPAILVPLVVSTTAHQRENARYMAGHGAAIHMPQGKFTPKTLADQLRTLDRDRLLQMAERAHALGRRGAADKVADQITQLVDAG